MLRSSSIAVHVAFVALVAGLFTAAPAVAAAPPIVLNEVLYDPAGADGANEFVEIVARAGEPGDASLAGWVLETGNGARPGEWSVEWTGGAGDRLIGGIFLVGESGVEPRPDAIVDLDLQNGPDACRLRGPGGEVDRLGWGAPLDSSFGEGEPATDVADGRSLARLPDGFDSDDNATDFHAADPTPGSFNAPALAILVEAFEFVVEGEGAGAWATATWELHNIGREPWAGEVELRCRVHPGEVLLQQNAPHEGVLAPGGRARIEGRSAPPPGRHRPSPQPAAPPGSAGPDTTVWAGAGDDLIINEVMNRPASGGAEWVEVRSVAVRAVDPTVFRFEDAAGTSAALAIGAPEASVAELPPGHFAIVTSDTAEFLGEWSRPPGAILLEASPWPSLNHTGSGDEVAERITFTLAGRGIAIAALPGGAAEGVAWERIAQGLDGDDLATWAPSLAGAGGSPGGPNTRDGDRPAPIGDVGSLTVAPAPFRPARDGTVLLVLRTKRPSGDCRMTIFDATGRPVANLAPWSASPFEHRGLWDGRVESGGPAPLGLYLATAETSGRRPARATLVVVR